MSSANAEVKRRGRPARHLLSGIAVCTVCGSSLRVGSQNTRGRAEEPSRYRVYECAGSTGNTGFHVSIRQEHLDRIVTDAIIGRVLEPDFRAPRAREEDPDGTERRALRLEIKSHRVWLDTVGKEARRRRMDYVLSTQERIVLPKIEAAQARIEELEQLNPLIDDLGTSRPVRTTWEALPLQQQRQVVQALLVPSVGPVPRTERGKQGLDVNTRRVQIQWRGAG